MSLTGMIDNTYLIHLILCLILAVLFLIRSCVCIFPLYLRSFSYPFLENDIGDYCFEQEESHCMCEFSFSFTYCKFANKSMKEGTFSRWFWLCQLLRNKFWKNAFNVFFLPFYPSMSSWSSFSCLPIFGSNYFLSARLVL